MVFDTDTGTAGNQTAWPDTTNSANQNVCADCHTAANTNFNAHTTHTGSGVGCLTCHIARPHGFTSSRNTTNRGHLLTDGTGVPTPYRGAVNVGGDFASECTDNTNCYGYIQSFATEGSWATSNCTVNDAAGSGGGGTH